MKVSKAQVARNREKILEVAGRLYRERGIDGIGVADIMKEAGLTHGAFYGHFQSKDDLIIQAFERAIDLGVKLWTKVAEGAGNNELAAVIDFYLSPAHRDDPGLTCWFAALGTDMGRQSAAIRAMTARGYERVIDFLASVMPGSSVSTRRRQAYATYSSLIGGVAMARTIQDPALANEITEAVMAEIHKNLGLAPRPKKLKPKKHR
jgi:TetR/AcrR family transcriptional repressor of nem operon